MIPTLLNESLTHSQITSNDAQTKRTTGNNLFKQLLLDQSTPEKSDSDSLNWHLKPTPPQPLQKPQPPPDDNPIGNPIGNPTGNHTGNPTGNPPGNPISQLKERIKQSNIQKRRDSRSSRPSADQELYEALGETSPRQIQPSVLLQQSQQSTQAQRVKDLEEQNRHLAKSCQVLQTQLQEAKQ